MTIPNLNPNFLNRKDPYIIAEVGGNHEGSYEYASKLLKLALTSNASAVKFQSYYADKIVSKVEDPNRNAHFKKFELSLQQFRDLAAMTKNSEIDFLSSFWDVDTLSELNPLVKIHKVGSGDLTNYLLLKKIAETAKPIIIATAMSSLNEVKESVNFILSVNPSLEQKKALAILHCVALYGNPLDEYANLSAIRVLQETFPNLPIGYSDHTIGITACQIAISMGCSVIEKHFTDDKTRTFRDHHIAATADEFKEIRAFSDKYQKMIGNWTKEPVKNVETTERIKEFRRATYLTVDAPAGTVLSEDNLTCLRPNNGIDSRKYFDILGKKLKVNKSAYTAISLDDLE